MTRDPGAFDTMVWLVIAGTFVVFLVALVMALGRLKNYFQAQRENDRKPIRVVAAKVVAKRTHVSSSHSPIEDRTQTATDYFVTFETQSGQRSEFHVPGSDYGLLAEKDSGKLRFQGTRYLGFERSA